MGKGAINVGASGGNYLNLTDEIPADPTPRDADTLGGHNASYFAVASDVTTQINNAISSAISSTVPTGTIIAVPTSTVPTGFLECNGALINPTTYSALFNKIGTAYGGNGTTTFGVPDLRGEFIRGFDNGRGVDSGRTIGSTQAGTNLLRTTLMDFIGNVANYDAGTPTVCGSSASGWSTTLVNTQSINGFNGLRPRNVAMMYCIKY